MCTKAKEQSIYRNCKGVAGKTHYLEKWRRTDWDVNSGLPDPCPNAKNEEGWCSDATIDDKTTFGSMHEEEGECPQCK